MIVSVGSQVYQPFDENRMIRILSYILNIV